MIPSKSLALGSALAVSASAALAADLPDALGLAQAADVCGGFVVESARYVDGGAGLAVTCGTAPLPAGALDDDAVGALPLIGTLGPGGALALGVGGLALIAGLSQDDDSGGPSDTQ
ncbi:hypothetical protein [Histidinibacterium lentulum]|uniref:Secreted protein n=1 Tax=Histidinibacterium lentulum TaxID=2480588 RepID=A0A3N2QSE7_9RHOB|nr:hypothetical protein [Histidinibacterium lentulum]ROT98104.1 hypothetical protein EAT49_17730 [Histidinibacterium lentulum]